MADTLVDLSEEMGDGVDIEVMVDDDGNADVIDNTREVNRPNTGFLVNLALEMEEEKDTTIAQDLIQLVDQDRQSRADWNQRMLNGLTVLGIKDIPDDQLPFPMASKAVHPGLSKVMVQFQARAIEELFPPAGPVKARIVGHQTEEKVQQAERVEEHMNWHLTERDAGYFPDTDQMLFYLPYEGSVFRKVAFDFLMDMPLSRYVKCENMVVNDSYRSFADAPRYTHTYEMQHNDVKRLMEHGIFTKYELPEIGEGPSAEENSDGAQLEEESDKLEPSGVVGASNDAQPIQVYEVHADLDPETMGDDENKNSPYWLPYIVTVDATNMRVLSIRRNWKEHDKYKRKRIWFAHYKYLPGFGFYGWGIMHIIGGLGMAATGAIRALLDSAMRSNTSGGFKSKDLKMAGTATWESGEWVDVDASAEELAKGFYTPPTPKPEPALFQLLQVLVEELNGWAAVTESMTGEASNTGPVGTTVALIEQSMKVFSAIHKRLHQAAGFEFRLIAELIHETMPEVYPYEVIGGERELKRSDFDERVDIVPVSDPNIFSSVQRIAVAQAVYQLVAENPGGIFDDRSVHEAVRRLLTALRVPDIDEILPQNEARRLDPVSENQNMLLGRRVRAFQDQLHEAHILVHGAFAQQIQSMGDNEMTNRLMGPLQAHIAEHLAFQYRNELGTMLLQQAGIQMPGYDPMDDRHQDEMPAALENQLTQVVAQLVNAMQMQQQEAAAQEPTEEQLKAAQMQADQERKNAGFEADQQRKQAAFEADQQRKSQVAEQRGVWDTIKQNMARLRGGGNGK